MDEKAFKAMTGTGVMNLVLGIIVLVGGAAMGTLLLVGGVRLLKSKSRVII